MQQVRYTVLDREDTIFGVCQALGEDFRFNANWLRVGLAVMLFFSPVAAIGGYAAAAVLVGASRLLVPNPHVPEAEWSEDEALEAEQAEPAAAEAEPREAADEIAIAA